MIHTKEEMSALIHEYECVPLFANRIKGWSIEEQCDPAIWFKDHVEGPWDWKGPIAIEEDMVYGKFFRNKAAFMTKSFYQDFANVRRDGYDFDSRIDEKLVSDREIQIYQLLKKHRRLTTIELMAYMGIDQKKKSVFEATLSKLQMSGYVIIDDFQYKLSKDGKPYGWGIAVYTIPELKFGVGLFHQGYKRTPEKSIQRMVKCVRKVMPGVEPSVLQALLNDEYDRIFKR